MKASGPWGAKAGATEPTIAAHLLTALADMAKLEQGSYIEPQGIRWGGSLVLVRLSPFVL